MTILTNFQQYTPEKQDLQELQEKLNILFIKSAEGVDWYESQSMFDPDKLKIVFDSSGVIIGAGKDVTTLWPLGYNVADIDYDINAKPEDFDGKVFNIRSGQIIDRVYSDAELKQDAERKIKGLQSKVTTLMAPLQSAKDLDMLTPEEAEHLDNLKRYLVFLSRVPTQKGYPRTIEWPELPKA